MNRGDNLKKQHSAAHHRNVRPEILTPVKKILELRRRKLVGSRNLVEFRTQMNPSTRVC